MTLALVMLAGSVPFSLADADPPVQSPDVMSPRAQMESGVASDDVECRKSLVLVTRTNGGAVACVTYDTAQKLGWELVRDVITPDLTKTQKPVLFPANPGGEPVEGLITAEFSSLPRLNEAVTVTVYYTNPYEDTPLSLGNELYVSIDDGWEFVNPPADKLTIVEENGTRPGSSMIDEPIVAAQGETKSLSVQVKPVKEGNLFISAGLAWGESKGFRLFVGEDRTISYDQYLRENPDIAAAMLAREIAENKALANLDPMSMIEPYMKEILEEQGYSEEEIEKIVGTPKNQTSDDR